MEENDDLLKNQRMYIYLKPELKKEVYGLAKRLGMSYSAAGEMLLTLGMTAFTMASNPENAKAFDQVLKNYDKI